MNLVIGIIVGALIFIIVKVSSQIINYLKDVRKEEYDMAVVYATLIIKGKKTIEDVPAKIRKQVEEILIDLEV